MAGRTGGVSITSDMSAMKHVKMTTGKFLIYNIIYDSFIGYNVFLISRTIFLEIDYLTPDNEILAEMGQRLARIRKQQGYTQTQLAEAAGIGVATLRRIEAGQDSQMESWLKLLKSLQMVSAINSILPENFNSPMAEALSAKKRRRKYKAATSPSTAAPMASTGKPRNKTNATTPGPSWGDKQS